MKVNGKFLAGAKRKNGKGVWRKMYEQYACSCCRQLIDRRCDRGAYGLIEYKGEAFCYNCGAHNTVEEEAK